MDILIVITLYALSVGASISINEKAKNNIATALLKDHKIDSDNKMNAMALTVAEKMKIAGGLDFFVPGFNLFVTCRALRNSNVNIDLLVNELESSNIIEDINDVEEVEKVSGLISTTYKFLDCSFNKVIYNGEVSITDIKGELLSEGLDYNDIIEIVNHWVMYYKCVTSKDLLSIDGDDDFKTLSYSFNLEDLFNLSGSERSINKFIKKIGDDELKRIK